MIARAARVQRGIPQQFRERPLQACVELVFPPGNGSPASPWNLPPGAVLRPTEQIVALNLAPGRWLLLDADSSWLAAAVSAGGVAIDVEGKWRCLEIRGAQAASALSAGVDLGLILEGRECAAVPLFDCPTVIAARPRDAGFDVCVHASYAASLCAALQAALDRSEGAQ